jgi:hypothetical protein
MTLDGGRISRTYTPQDAERIDDDDDDLSMTSDVFLQSESYVNL